MPISTGSGSSSPEGGMVAQAVVGIPTLLCLWISEIIASLPGRCAVTVLELLSGTMLTGYGSISQAILAVPCRRHWTSYYWMVRKGKFAWKVMVHALCRIVKREFPSERCVVVGDDTLIPRVSAAAPGAAIQYDHARKPNRPDYLLPQTVVSLSAVIGNSWGSWSVPLMSNLARQPRQARNDAGPGGGGEHEPGRDHAAARRLVHEGIPDRRCPHARRHRHRPGDTALYEPPPAGKPGRPRKYGDRITKAKLKTLGQTHTELPIYGSHPTVRYRTAVCRARFLGGRPVRAVWLSMFVEGKWKAERLLLSTDPSHTAEDVIMTYSLRWTIEPMFAALKWSEGMIDMWMQSVDPKGSGSKTFHRWLNIVQIGRALIQMLAVKADAATTALAQVAAWRKERYLTAGMVKAGLVRAFWNIAPAEAWHRRGRKFDPSRRVPMKTRVVHTAIAA